MSRLRRHCVLVVVGFLAAAGLLSAPRAGALTYTGQFASGDVTLIVPDCTSDISNNFVNGSLTVIAAGLYCVGIDLTMNVYGNVVGGNLSVVVSHNTVDYGNIAVNVHDNPQVGGMTNVHVNTNTVHRQDPATFGNYNLYVNVDKNGGNNANAANNEVIAEGIDVEVNDNWVKNTLYANLRDNFDARDMVFKANGNMVNNLYSWIERNRACRDMDVSFDYNLIDTNFYLSANENRATRDVKFALRSNKVIYLDPMRFEAVITDNHAATRDIDLTVSGTIAKMVIVRFEDNGAGGDGRFGASGNSAILFVEVQINRNRVDGRSTIRVIGNSPNPRPYIISSNWACKSAPVLQLQPSPVVSYNQKGCTQTVAGDGDLDGLTNDYERMIGTDPGNRDTDRDGLWDGWNDTDGTGAWESGSEFGELGDPLRPLGGSHRGAVDTLFNRPSEAPNCFCKDLYIEVDFMEKGETIPKHGWSAFGVVVNKTADVRQARPGDLVNYTISYNNTGPVAKQVWINDTLPSLVTFLNATPAPAYSSGLLVRWNFTMVTQGSYWVDLKVRINSTASIGTSLVNRVILNHTDQRGMPGPPSFSNVTVVVSNTRLSNPTLPVQNLMVGETAPVIGAPDGTADSASPERLDVESVQMAEGIPVGGTYSLVDKPHFVTWSTVKPLVAAFKKRGISLHVDLGWPTGAAGGNAPGGGEILKHKTLLPFRNATAFDFFNYKNGEVARDYDGNGFREKSHFSLNRGGIFRYAIIGHNYSEVPTSAGVGELVGDDFFISHGNFLGAGYTGAGIRQALGYALCHELGHNLGLGASPGTHENAPANYWSCMSYNPSVAFAYIGYSDGLFGSSYDWPAINFEGGLTRWRGHNFVK